MFSYCTSSVYYLHCKHAPEYSVSFPDEHGIDYNIAKTSHVITDVLRYSSRIFELLVVLRVTLITMTIIIHYSHILYFRAIQKA